MDRKRKRKGSGVKGQKTEHRKAVRVDKDAKNQGEVKPEQEETLPTAGIDFYLALVGMVRERGKREDEARSDDVLEVSSATGGQINRESDDDVDDEEEGSAMMDDPEDGGTTPIDLYHHHFQHDIDEDLAAVLSKPRVEWQKTDLKSDILGDCSELTIPSQAAVKLAVTPVTLLKQQLKEKLIDKLEFVNGRFGLRGRGGAGRLTRLQRRLLVPVLHYQDVVFPRRSHENGEELRFIYTLHALNHALKIRGLVRHHNSKLALAKAEGTSSDHDYRDESLIRPKILILVPFRESAVRVVNMICGLLPERQFIVSGKKRFEEEFVEEEEIVRKSKKPVDYEHLFAGNTDDCFKLGLSFTKKAFKLYSDFYTSDMIIASPLGLRTIVGVEGDKERESDFLHSIELLVLDQCDVLQMQNWEHVQLILNHLHTQPRDSHGVDFSRVRHWNLNSWGKIYRQTLVFSDILTPEILALFHQHCFNYAGKLLFHTASSVPAISKVVVDVAHVFQKLEAARHADVAAARFHYFIDNILPQFVENVETTKHVLIFVPSYFDYVKIRNYLKKKEVKVSAISENISDANVSRARNSFYAADRSILLYTERYHFFRRTSFKRVSHVVFYQLPHYPAFYHEVCNMLRFNQARNQDTSCLTLYSKYDALRLAPCVGEDRASHMIQSQKKVHMLVTGRN